MPVTTGAFIGGEVPVWDIAYAFGDETNLVTNTAQGDDLARRLGDHNVVLMRATARGRGGVDRRGGEDVDLPAAKRAGAGESAEPGWRRETAIEGRDRGEEPRGRLSAELAGDAAGVAVLGAPGGLRRYAIEATGGLDMLSERENELN